MNEIRVIEIKIKDLKKKYAKLRIDHSLSQLSDTSQLKKMRREIARHYTSYMKQMKPAGANVDSTKNSSKGDE